MSFYITQKEIKAHVVRLTDGLHFAKTVPGTQSHCKFELISTSELQKYLVSSGKEGMGT
jgi:hypothetical protein